jgi:hypothetical protein
MTNGGRLAKRVRGAIDRCHFYWHGRDGEENPSPEIAPAPRN